MATIFPLSASASQQFQDYIFNGESWNAVGSGLFATISSNPPASPNQGDLWFDSDTNELFMYDSVYWIEVSGTATDLAPYLTISSASTIYATQVDLDNIDALPSQSGNAGKYLTTSGSVASWGTLDLSLYLTQSSASTTYATQADLNNINGESDQFILPSQVFG